MSLFYREGDRQFTVALAGNPNTGKSTLFNALTGLRQHTGNWPGKTVLQAEGSYLHKGYRYTLMDLPGTYSLFANSADEEVARDFICWAHPDTTLVVVDATCLERNLNLVLQVTEITNKVIVCLNLIDEARRKNLWIDVDALSSRLGVPIAVTSARSGEGLYDLMNMVSEVSLGQLVPRPKRVCYTPRIEAAVKRLEPQIRLILGEVENPRWIALRLLEGDSGFMETIHREMLA